MTKILTYTPGIQAYVRTSSPRGDKDIVLSEDIVSFSVTLNTDACSTFSITLQNKGGKYTGAFYPMDRIVIYLTKKDTVPVFAGYITNAPYYKLNNGDVTISGKDVLYRLQKLYWDTGLLASRELVTFQSADTSDIDGGYWRAAVRILLNVANWNPDSIIIGEIPNDAVEFAYEAYKIRALDTQGADLINQVYSMLQSTGVSFSELSPSTPSGEVYDGDVSSAQKAIIEIAMNSSKYGIPAEGGYCQKWVSDVFEKAKVSSARPASAREGARQWGASTDWSKIVPGACVYGYGWNNEGNPGNIYGHVGIYVGNNRVFDNIGGVKEWSLQEWVNAGNNIKPQGTGWGWHGGVIFDDRYACRKGLLP